MKFGTVWKTRVNSLPQHIRETCLDYKKYKKLSKRSTTDPSFIHSSLVCDINKVDATLSKVMKPPTLLNKLCANPLQDQLPDLKYIYEYVLINTTTLYKICKRLDKRLQTAIFKAFYTEHHKTHKFLSRKLRTSLNIEVGNEPDECPICFEPLHNHSRPYLVLRCGHIVCEPCIFEMLGVANTRGTVYNRIAFGCANNKKISKCPICRDTKALLDYKEYK